MGKFSNRIKKDFSITPNQLINDHRLSAQARFVFVYMASKPEGWDFYLDTLANELNMSVPTLRKYMKELKTIGWLIITGQTVGQGGRFGSNNYELMDKPDSPCAKKHRTVKYTVRQKNRVGKISTHNKKDILSKKDINISKTEDKAAAKNENSFEKNYPEPKSQPNSHQDAKEKEKNSAQKEKEDTGAIIGDRSEMKRIWQKRFPDYIWQDSDGYAATKIFFGLKKRLQAIENRRAGMYSKIDRGKVIAEWERIVQNLPAWILDKGYLEVAFIQKKINAIINEIDKGNSSSQPKRKQAFTPETLHTVLAHRRAMREQGVDDFFEC